MYKHGSGRIHEFTKERMWSCGIEGDFLVEAWHQRSGRGSGWGAEVCVASCPELVHPGEYLDYKVGLQL